MRAARASIVIQEVLRPVGNVLQEAIASQHAHYDYIVQTVVPLLATVAIEVCKNGAAYPHLDATLALLRMCCTDERVLAEVDVWAHGCKARMTIGEDDEAGAQAFVENERAADEVTFYFVDADFIRMSKMNTLPSWQELKQQPEILVRRTFSKGDAYRRRYCREYCAVSHRWESSEQPDAEGAQLKKIREHLLMEGADVKFVWFDYWCMPQGKRTKAEMIHFRWMHYNANLLFLGASVLLLVDISYLIRFWTQYEAWMSLQTTTSTGLRPAEKHEQRFTIKCIHDATRGLEDKKLISMWAQADADDARIVLDEAPVTDEEDKEVHLDKVAFLHDEVCEAFSAIAVKQLQIQGIPLADFRSLGFSVEAMEEAGYTLRHLRIAGYGIKEVDREPLEIQDFIEAGYSFQDVLKLRSRGPTLEARYDTRSIKNAGYSAEQLKDAGFVLWQLLDAGYTIQELHEAGFSARDFNITGIHAWQLQEIGLTAASLREGGYDARQLREAGYKMKELTDVGFSARELCHALYHAKAVVDAGYDVKDVLKAGFPAQQLRAAGCSATQLREGGYLLFDLEEAGYKEEQLREAGFETKHFTLLEDVKEQGRVTQRQAVLRRQNYQHGAAQLRRHREARYTAAQLKAAGYTAAQLHESGFTLQDLREADIDIGPLTTNTPVAALSKASVATERADNKLAFARETNTTPRWRSTGSSNLTDRQQRLYRPLY